MASGVAADEGKTRRFGGSLGKPPPGPTHRDFSRTTASGAWQGRNGEKKIIRDLRKELKWKEAMGAWDITRRGSTRGDALRRSPRETGKPSTASGWRGFVYPDPNRSYTLESPHQSSFLEPRA